MKSDIRPLERAFELARSGKVRGIDDIRKMLAGEGHSSNEIEGSQIRAQLRTLIKAALDQKAALTKGP